MAHTIKDKRRLIARVRRISGQVSAVEKALHEDRDCSSVLQTVAACRGALNALMAELIEDHVRFHLLPPAEKPSRAQARAADELIRVVEMYLK